MLLDSLESGIEIEAPEAVAEIEEVNATLALKVINVEGKLGTWNSVDTFGIDTFAATKQDGEDGADVPIQGLTFPLYLESFST